MSVPERRVLAVLVLASAVLLAVGIPLGWSEKAMGTTFILIGAVATAVGAMLAPRESPPQR